jgi:hypothetical protein
MKLIVMVLTLISLNAWSQDPTAYLNNFDSKVYSLKSRGVKDFVVDLESTKLTKQMNEAMIFGKVEEVIFRLFWTANPERLAIEVMGLPEGFREIKEELKLSILSVVEHLVPPGTIQKFAGYKFSAGNNTKEFLAEDSTGIAMVPGYLLKFDNQDRMIEIQGRKNFGTLNSIPKYDKEKFADNKWVLKSLTTTNSENGHTMISRKEFDYGLADGIGVLKRIKITTEQKLESGSAKPLILEEEIEFKNYKINSGEGLKYFLSEGTKAGQ